MTYIAGLVIVGLLFLTIKYFTELTRQQEIIAGSIILAIVFGAISFNAYSENQREKMLDVVLKFNQDKTVICNGVDVNNTNFTLSIGTYTFIGKKETPHYALMISASDCE